MMSLYSSLSISLRRKNGFRADLTSSAIRSTLALGGCRQNHAITVQCTHAVHHSEDHWKLTKCILVKLLTLLNTGAVVFIILTFTLHLHSVCNSHNTNDDADNRDTDSVIHNHHRHHFHLSSQLSSPVTSITANNNRLSHSKQMSVIRIKWRTYVGPPHITTTPYNQVSSAVDMHASVLVTTVGVAVTLRACS